jgi:hypothetical protein
MTSPAQTPVGHCGFGDPATPVRIYEHGRAAWLKLNVAHWPALFAMPSVSMGAPVCG